MDRSVQKDTHTVNSVLFARHDLVCSQKRINPGNVLIPPMNVGSENLDWPVKLFS